MKAAEILKEARVLISDEARWTQGAFARDAKGRSEALSRAVCFCSIGAIAKVARTNLVNPVPKPILEAFGVRSHAELARFNDNNTHADVLARFDDAILAASSTPNQAEAGKP